MLRRSPPESAQALPDHRPRLAALCHLGLRHAWLGPGRVQPDRAGRGGARPAHGLLCRLFRRLFRDIRHQGHTAQGGDRRPAAARRGGEGAQGAAVQDDHRHARRHVDWCAERDRGSERAGAPRQPRYAGGRGRCLQCRLREHPLRRLEARLRAHRVAEGYRLPGRSEHRHGVGPCD
jgi:hypothetical protein